jgi:imidazole glycerol-phosphate synthase subunit HisH
VAVTSRPEDVAAADHIVLPGVGAFADCKRGLAAVDGMIDALEDAVRRRGQPFLGICVGMQLMATRGLEYETTQGLDWIAGDVAVIHPDDPSLKIPHMGWNTLKPLKDHPILADIETGQDGKHAYFVHSFQLTPTNESDLIAVTTYGGRVTSIVGRDNIVGTQFHPEKSQTLGLKLIANFLKWRP